MSKPNRSEDKANLTVVPGGSTPTSMVEVKLLYGFCFFASLVLLGLILWGGLDKAAAFSVLLVPILWAVPRRGNGPSSSKDGLSNH